MRGAFVMQSTPVILFDLDGTLTDPKAGITRSFQYALETMGQPVPSEDDLEWVIGPPLRASFVKVTISGAIIFYKSFPGQRLSLA